MIKMQAKKIETMRREFQNRAVGPKPSGDCPDTEAIWDAAAGELPVEKRRKVVSHLSSCAECTHAWRLAWAMQTEMRHEESQNTYATVVWNQWKRFAPQVAAAAMLVLALGVGVLLNRPEPEPATPVHRGAVVEHEIQSLIPEGEALPRDEFVLRWSPGPSNATYRIRVLDEEMNELAQADDLPDSVFQVAPEALKGISTQGNVYWYVEAYEAGALVNQASFVTQVK